MNVQGKQGVTLRPSTLFTRRTYQLTVDTLLPFRLGWTATPDGFTVTLEAAHGDGTTSPLVVHLVAIPCAFGGQRYLFRCPGCGRRRAALFWSDERLLCRTCAKLRYVSVTWSADERLERHYRRRQRTLDTGLGRLSARAASYSIRAEIHAARWFGRCARGLFALEARLEAREAK
jgi:hypothetical protein